MFDPFGGDFVEEVIEEAFLGGPQYGYGRGYGGGYGYGVDPFLAEEIVELEIAEDFGFGF
jgi:hypothetical protein